MGLVFSITNFYINKIYQANEFECGKKEDPTQYCLNGLNAGPYIPCFDGAKCALHTQLALRQYLKPRPSKFLLLHLASYKRTMVQHIFRPSTLLSKQQSSQNSICDFKFCCTGVRWYIGDIRKEFQTKQNRDMQLEPS